MLRVANLSFSYRQFPFRRMPVLREVSFDLMPGRCMVVAGSNGCGKSTLLSILSGALPGAEGTIETDGETFGLIPQGFAVFEDLSVLENLRFFSGLSHQTLARPLPFGLEPYASRRAGLLSGGLKKRLCIACTSVARPDIWLFDEPCANLDIVWRDEMIQMILDLKAADKGVIYVGHEPSEFVPFYDSILFLRNGTGTLLQRDRIPPGSESSLIRELIRADEMTPATQRIIRQ